jgi:hypothetical protein
LDPIVRVGRSNAVAAIATLAVGVLAARWLGLADGGRLAAARYRDPPAQIGFALPPRR